MIKKFVRKNEGLTLVEILAVVVIFGILAAVAVPSVLGHIKKTEEEVCDINTSELEKRYQRELVLESKVHSDAIFSSFLIEHGDYVCPVGGTYQYVGGEVECSEHSEDDEEEEDVPFL